MEEEHKPLVNTERLLKEAILQGDVEKVRLLTSLPSASSSVAKVATPELLMKVIGAEGVKRKDNYREMLEILFELGAKFDASEENFNHILSVLFKRNS